MGFISYNLRYYKEKLEEYEKKYQGFAPKEAIHEAKILMKALADMIDEGYSLLPDLMTDQYDGVNRLLAFIRKNNDEPFPFISYSLTKPRYGVNEYPLNTYLDNLISRVNYSDSLEVIPPFYFDLLGYTKYLFEDIDKDTAYIFLLRDTMFPFLAFREWTKDMGLSIYPYLIGRKFLSFFSSLKTQQEGISENMLDPNGDSDELYSEIHRAIFNALEKNPDNLKTMTTYVEDTLINSLKEFPEAYVAIRNLLSVIPQKRIMVIESGYLGSIPMLLSSLDDRIDFRLFTTVPYLYKVYSDKYYTTGFEKIREFETIQSQDALFKLSSLNGNTFMVTETVDSNVLDFALRELGTWSKLTKR